MDLQKQVIPQACRTQCSQIEIDSCALKTTPATEEAWNTEIINLANCICPKLTASNQCGSCLITTAPSASTYYQNLNSLCGQNAAAPEIGKLFNKVISTQRQQSAPPTSEPGAEETPKSSANALFPVLTISLIAGVLMF